MNNDFFARTLGRSIWCGCVALGGLFGAPAIADVDTAVRTELDQYLDDTRAAHKMPGFRAAVRFPNGQIVSGAVGVADKKSAVPLDEQIGMPGGSTGKTFVATLTMLLIEDGVLNLDDRAEQWLGDTPWFARLPNAETITVRHLLSHSAGIADYGDTAKARFGAIWRVLRRGSIQFEPEELIGFVLDRKPLFEPGNGFHYTDAGYLVLGRLIESAAGASYYDLLTTRVLEPHDLTDIRPADRSIIENVATGYASGAPNRKKDGRMKYDPSSEWTGGGLITTPRMLVHFFGALTEARIVRADTLATMRTPVWRNPGASTQYALGLFLFDDGERIGHGGMWPGYRTHVIHHPASGITTAVQTNRDGRLDLHAMAKDLESRARRWAHTP